MVWAIASPIQYDMIRSTLITCVVLLQAEGRSFCACYDISAKEPGTDDWRSNPTTAHQHLSVQLDFEMTPWAMKKPVIASVQSHVMGGGCELVMLCDLTIAADNAPRYTSRRRNEPCPLRRSNASWRRSSPRTSPATAG
jgi:1,4-dihydroxy-2-naphthoyl-CoA synthase